MGDSLSPICKRVTVLTLAILLSVALYGCRWFNGGSSSEICAVAAVDGQSECYEYCEEQGCSYASYYPYVNSEVRNCGCD